MPVIDTDAEPVQIHDVSDGLAHVRRCVDSREWWLIVAASPQGRALIGAVERRHYAGDTNRFFHLLLIPRPFGLVGLVLAQKTFMLPSELATLAGVPSIDPEKDIVITPDVPQAALWWLTEVLR